MSDTNKRQLTEEEVERINRYMDQCPRPLAGGGYKNTVTGDYIEYMQDCADEFINLERGE